MAMKAKHAFGNLADVQAALDAGKIDAFDILFLDGDTEPKIGWVDKNGILRLVENETDLSGVEADISDLESQVATKVDTEEVEALESQIATKVDAEAVQAMIEEYSESAIEVVEF